MPATATSEFFDTGLNKIRHEIKSQLATHGLYGTVTERAVDGESAHLTLVVSVKGREAVRSFGRVQIEACHLRVDRAVMTDIIAMTAELSA